MTVTPRYRAFLDKAFALYVIAMLAALLLGGLLAIIGIVTDTLILKQAGGIGVTAAVILFLLMAIAGLILFARHNLSNSKAS